jgi:large subunit ribosomal protein L6
VSRIGRNPVQIPKGVEVQLAGQILTAKSKAGERRFTIADDVGVSVKDGKIELEARSDSKRARTLWGTTRSLLQGAVKGLAEPYKISLEIQGVGFRAAVEKNALVLQLGFSHEVRYTIPKGITIQCERPTLVHIGGADKEQVGQVAAEIRGYRKPEPYKGKGIRYVGEQVREKEGKKK